MGEDKFSTDKLGQPINLDELADLSFVMEGNLDNTLNEELFNADIIADLLNKNLLLIDNSRELKTLTITLQCEPDSLTPEQRTALTKYIRAILREFRELKEEKHIPDDCVNMLQDIEGNIHSLTITLPTQALYDAFIQKLANNLLPSPILKLQSNKETLYSSSGTPDPILAESKTSTTKVIQTDAQKEEGQDVVQGIHAMSEDEEQMELFNPSPFSTDLNLK